MSGPDAAPPPVFKAARGWQVDEAQRRAIIAAHDLDTLRRSTALEQITDFAAQLCEAPIALVSLVEERHQVFLSRTGLEIESTPREQSFCAHAMLEDGVMTVRDAAADARFADNPLVTGAPHIRFYAGAPLVSDDGIPLGSLCVIDTAPRAGLTPLQEQGLTVLAANVMARLRDSRDAAAWRAAENEARRAATDSDARFRTLADTMPQMVWSALPDGYVDYYNARWYEFTGAPVGSTEGEAWSGMLHADDREHAWASWRRSLTGGEPYDIEYRLRHAGGTYRWVLARALPIRGEDGSITRWFGTCTDIHEQKLASEEREVISQELSHRIKNIFSVVAGLVQFTARANPAIRGVADDLRQRITALGRAHDFVRPHSPASASMARPDSLTGLLEELFAPYQRKSGDRLIVTGEDLLIDDRAATPLALLFHELATNATKYGALSNDVGQVAVAVALEADEAVMTWHETGGPLVTATGDQHGFGTQLLDLSVLRQLGGTLKRDWRPEGLVVTARVPRAALSRS